MQKFTPVGVNRIEKTIDPIFANLIFGRIRQKIAEEVLAGEDQAEDKPHDHNLRNTVFFEDIALL